jgi:hypothetical protein
MRVYDSNLSGASALQTTRGSETSGSSRAAGGSSYTSKGDGDRVEISSTLYELSRSLISYSEERTSAVQAISNQYQTGRYRVDAVATGRALISDALASVDA